jgi:hypothetical protein
MSDNSLLAVCIASGAIAFCVALGGASYVGGERAKAAAAESTHQAALAIKYCGKAPKAEGEQ